MWPVELLALSKKLSEDSDESDWFALWNVILNLNFPFEEGYFVSPVVDADEGPDWESHEFLRRVYIVQQFTTENGELKCCDIFFVEVKAGRYVQKLLARKDADYLMQYRFGMFLSLPATLHAVSAFGARMCFYKMERDPRRVSPKKVQEEDLSRIVDTCPVSWWEKDVFTQAGYDAFMKVVAEAKEQGRRELASSHS
ncbi:hypothetical protein ACEPAG_2759 [Sanghuangporus baumii]